jgi:RAT1-interacting protein
MEIYASALLPSFSNVSVIIDFLPNSGSFFTIGLKTKVQGEGLWRIRKREKSPVIELFKVEQSGHGDIISPAFMEWRKEMSAS